MLPAPDTVFSVAPVVTALISTIAPLDIAVDTELSTTPLPDSANVPAVTDVAPVYVFVPDIVTAPAPCCGDENAERRQSSKAHRDAQEPHPYEREGLNFHGVRRHCAVPRAGIESGWNQWCRVHHWRADWSRGLHQAFRAILQP